MHHLMPLIRHIKLFTNGEFESYTFLFSRISSGVFVPYASNETASRSDGRKVYQGRADHACRQYSRRLDLFGHPNRNMCLNMWQDDPVYHFWRDK